MAVPPQGRYVVIDDDVQRPLDDLGPRGCELVTTYHAASFPGVTDEEEGVFLIFKRPKED
jgi:hypothetical protein